ncbi:MAG TPA: PAS domain S-box protein [bacterium]|nr:PAS domain S-box protein [bacterium]
MQAATGSKDDPLTSGTVLVGVVDGATRARVVGTVERAGFDVNEVHEGGRLLDLARRAPPDVIVISRDLVRPDALEVSRRLSSDPATRAIPILLLGKGIDGEAYEAFDAGAAALIPVTAGEKDLVAHVRTLALRGGALRPQGSDAHRQLLLDLARVMATDRDPRAALHAAVRRVAEATGALSAGVVLLSAGGKRAFVLATSPERHAHARIALSKYPVLLKAATDGRLASDEDPQDDPYTEKNQGGPLLALPILHRGVALGLLTLRFPERVTPDASSVRLAELVSLVAAAPLVTTREIARGAARVRARASEKALRMAAATGDILETRAFLERLIDSSRDAIIASDMRGTVLVFNEAAEKITGHRAEDVIGKLSVSDVYPPGTAKEIMRLLRSPESGGVGFATDVEAEILSREGKIPILLSAAVIYDDEGREIATVGFFTDLRERLAIERRLKDAQAALIQTEKQAAVAELAGSAAHELNQPLTAIMGYAELMLKKMTPEDPNRRFVQTLYEEAERMAAVVKKIGRITRYESKSYVGGTRIVDLDKSSRRE